MVDQLSSFAAEGDARLAGKVGTEGVLGGQAEVADVSGVWRELTRTRTAWPRSWTSQVQST